MKRHHKRVTDVWLSVVSGLYPIWVSLHTQTICWWYFIMLAKYRRTLFQTTWEGKIITWGLLLRTNGTTRSCVWHFFFPSFKMGLQSLFFKFSSNLLPDNYKNSALWIFEKYFAVKVEKSFNSPTLLDAHLLKQTVELHTSSEFHAYKHAFCFVLASKSPLGLLWSEPSLLSPPHVQSFCEAILMTHLALAPELMHIAYNYITSHTHTWE